mgnify:CR=1 FL=1
MIGDLTAFQRDILYVLAGLDDPAGIDVKDELDEYYTASVEHSRLYQALNRLVDKQLVEKGEKDARTNEYGLSDDGETLLRRHHEWREQHFHSLRVMEIQEHAAPGIPADEG